MRLKHKRHIGLVDSRGVRVIQTAVEATAPAGAPVQFMYRDFAGLRFSDILMIRRFALVVGFDLMWAGITPSGAIQWFQAGS